VVNRLPALYPLGIVGSGQIARMTHQAAVKLGFAPRLFAERFDDSAAQAAAGAVFNHPDSLAAFAEDCQVLTFEHERIDVGMLQAMEQDGAKLRPGLRTIRAAFDKTHQRRVLKNKGFIVPRFAEVRGPDDVFDFAGQGDFPVVIKTAKAAKPGRKGVWIVERRDEAMRVLAEQSDQPLMVEEFQDILKELVVLVVRRPGGHLRHYPIAEISIQDGLCTEIRTPADVGSHLASEARQTAAAIANELDAVGVLAVEFFLTAEGLMVNELAARPHNAGHFTIEACPTSQFENHVRAVLDLPLGPSRNLADALAIEGARVHLYGKQPRPGRKLGHVTALGDDLGQARELARRAEAALHGRKYL